MAFALKKTMAGYSATPLAKKLGLRAGSRLFISDAPSHYRQLIGPALVDVTLVKAVTREMDIVHLFVTSKAKLASALKRLLVSLRPNAAIWVSWPKRASKLPTDITEDTIREVALPLGLVDIKVCAVDETWSGLKLVLRKDRRAAHSAPDPR